MRTPFPLGSRELANGAETAASRSVIRRQQLPLVKMLPSSSKHPEASIEHLYGNPHDVPGTLLANVPCGIWPVARCRRDPRPGRARHGTATLLAGSATLRTARRNRCLECRRVG